jgi:hypothetical protein
MFRLETTVGGCLRNEKKGERQTERCEIMESIWMSAECVYDREE